MKIGIALSLMLLTAVIATIYYWQSDSMDMDMNMPTNTQTQNEEQPLYWVAPMDANYRRDEPGLSPMGMALIPVYAAGDTISVSSSVQQNLGVRTAPVLLENFSPSISAVGYSRWDESSIKTLHTRADGWLEEFYLASVGETVSAGDPIYALFAPELVSAQREYLSAIRSSNTNMSSIAGDRLRALGFTPSQIDQLKLSGEVRDRLVFHAERDAIVTHIGARQGSHVVPSTPLVTLASLDEIWIEAEVFESMTSWVQPGLPVRISFPAYPGESFSNEVSYLYPELDPTTRSLRLRIVMENKERKLRPNMFTRVEIDAIEKLNVLTVPREAVIRAGQGDRVILALGEGRFRPQVVRTGISNRTRIEVLSGLSEGEAVVTSGQFLLDSEANGEQAFARLTTDSELQIDTSTEMAMSSDEDMSMSTTPGAATNVADVYSSTGNITEVRAGESVTISHGAVPELNWPAMVMGFQVPAQMSIDSFEVGDSVAFEFTATAQGMYQLSRIRARGDSQ